MKGDLYDRSRKENLNNNSVRIVVATHKPYPMPKDTMYLPVFVGAELNVDGIKQFANSTITPDNIGEHISGKNPGFCELTALYWAWKNISDRYVGLVHYRRHFSGPGRKRKPNDVLCFTELQPLLNEYSIFLPKKRNYVIESLYSHYAHTHDAAHLDLTRQIIEKSFPDYLVFFDRVMKKRSGYMFNMMIMRRDLLDRYCNWLFPILFELESLLKGDPAYENLSSYQKRLFGRVSELLLNVWLEYEISCKSIKPEEICELPWFSTERTNWMKKGIAFLSASILHTKYKESF